MAECERALRGELDPAGRRALAGEPQSFTALRLQGNVELVVDAALV